MSEAKHTPGPWTHNLDDGGFTIFGSDGTHICWRATPFANIDRTRILADVVLLTLAPETAAERDALREEVARLKGHNEKLLAVCEAVKKESNKMCADCRWQDYSVGPHNPEPCQECYVDMTWEAIKKFGKGE